MSGYHALFEGPSTGRQMPSGVNMLGLPFDTVRAWYAIGVQAGLIRRSMLESRDFERALGSVERLLLGPLARRV